MSAHRERMDMNLIDEPEDECRGPNLPYTVLHSAGRRGKQVCQEPFKVATACLMGVCLILLLILLTTRLHTGKASTSGQVSSSSSETHMQTACANVTTLTAELQSVKQQKTELEKERAQLKDTIAKLEAKSAPQTTPAPMNVSCPESWRYFKGSCYYISEDSRSWSSSRSFCQRSGGDLAIVLTAEEQTFLWDLLPRGHWNAYWIGISDEKTEDDWEWVDGTYLVGGFWDNGEPNNDVNEDCGYIVKTDVLTRVAIKSWYDAPCYMPRHWICEKKTQVSESPVECTDVSALSSELHSLKQRKRELEKERAQLKDTITRLEAKSATQTTPAPTNVSCPESWRYFKGSCYYISEDSRSWSSSRGFCQRSGGDLAIVLTAEEQTFLWDLLPRGHWNAYWIGISDKETEDDWQWVDGTKLVGGFWEEGEPNNHINEDCGYIVKTRVLTRVAVMSWYDAPCDMPRHWICETKAQVSETPVQCADMSALTAELQSVKQQKRELETERAQLKDTITRLEAKSAPQTTPAPTNVSCPESWRYFEGSCYYISRNSETWSDSRTFCQRSGGDLAIVLTAEEQTFLWDLLPRGHWNAYWIGISDEKTEDDWEWVDGTKLVGGFWEEGEPNNHIDEDCGYIVKTTVLTRVAVKSWYDAPCDMDRRWICEKKAFS